MVAQQLAALDRTLKIEFRWIESEGDQKADGPLADAGGKGLFVRAIEQAILSGQADLAVHSLKDLPVTMTPGLTLAAIGRRADVRDCLVSSAGWSTLDQIPPGARLGTASPRRAAQLLNRRPDLQIQLLRGNVETRLRKVLEEKTVEATLMAVAGLVRSGHAEHAAHPLDPAVILPPAGQGCLALQCALDDHVTLRRTMPLNDPLAGTVVHAERQFVAGLGGDCHAALAVLVEAVDVAGTDRASASRQDRGTPHYRLRGRVLSPDGRRVLEVDEIAAIRHVGKMVKRAVADLKERGALDLLATGKSAAAPAAHPSL